MGVTVQVCNHRLHARGKPCTTTAPVVLALFTLADLLRRRFPVHLLYNLLYNLLYSGGYITALQKLG